MAYVDSEGLSEALSKQHGGNADDVAPALEVLSLVASAERGSEHPLATVRRPPYHGTSATLNCFAYS